jgi:hypothetical protein
VDAGIKQGFSNMRRAVFGLVRNNLIFESINSVFTSEPAVVRTEEKYFYVGAME